MKSLFGSINIHNGFIDLINPAVTISFVQQKEELIKLRLVALYLKDHPGIAISVICRPAGHTGFLCAFPTKVPESAVLNFSFYIAVYPSHSFAKLFHSHFSVPYLKYTQF